MKPSICKSIRNRRSVTFLLRRYAPLKIFVFTLFALSAQPAAAEVNLLLKIDGVPGESTIANHEDEIDLLAWNWKLQSPVGSQGSGRRRASSCSGDIEFTKYLDLASAPLLMAQLMGVRYPEVVLTVQYNSGEMPVEFLTLTLSNTMVTSMNTGVSTDGDGVYEQLTFAFESMVFAYTDAYGDGGQNEAVIDNIQSC